MEAPYGATLRTLRLLDTNGGDPSFVYQHDTLRRSGVRAFKPGLAILNRLGVLATSGLLAQDIQEKLAAKPGVLKEILLERATNVYVEAGCLKHELAFLGTEQLSPKQFKEKILSLPPLAPLLTDTSPSASSLKSGVVNAAKGIHDFLVHYGDEEWLSRTIQADEERNKNRKGRKRTRKSSSKTDLSPGVEEQHTAGEKPGASAGTPGSAASRQTSEDLQPGASNLPADAAQEPPSKTTVGQVARQLLDVEPKSVEVCEPMEFSVVVGFDGDGESIDATVSSDRVLNAKHLERLAKWLLKKAHSMRPTNDG
jgi:hypothetical protein